MKSSDSQKRSEHATHQRKETPLNAWDQSSDEDDKPGSGIHRRVREDQHAVERMMRIAHLSISLLDIAHFGAPSFGSGVFVLFLASHCVLRMVFMQ